MAHFLNSLLLVAVFAILLVAVQGIRSFVRNRREQVAPFRNYFSTEYDQDLLRCSALSEDEEWLADLRPRANSASSCDSKEHE